MSQKSTSIFFLAVAILLVCSGVLASTDVILNAFSVSFERTLIPEVRQGALLFRIGLIMLGTFLFVSRKWSKDITSQSDFAQVVSRPNKIVAGLILVVALCLRLIDLNSGLWLDEIRTLVSFARAPFGEIVTTYVSENQHLFYTIVSHFSLSIFGESSWSLRLPAVLFGVGSIWALYLFGKEITNATETLLAMVLLTISYHHVWFSQNARGYTALLFWTLLSSWFLLRALQQNHVRLWAGYACCVALGVYTHATMLFVIAGQLFVFWNGTRRDPSRSWNGLWFGFIFAGVLMFLLHSLVLPQMLTTVGMKTIVEVWNSPLWTLRELFAGLRLGFGFIAVTVGIAIFSIGLLSYKRDNITLIYLLLIPAISGSAVVIVMQHPLWPRFFFFAVGFIALVVVRGIMKTGESLALFFRMKMNPRIAGVVLSGLLLLFALRSLPMVYGPKQDFDGAMRFIKESLQPGDSVVIVGLSVFPFSRLYRTGWTEVKDLKDLMNVRTRSNRTWLVYTFPLMMQFYYPDMMPAIQQDFRVIKEFPGTLKEGIIIVCRSDGRPAGGAI